MKISIKLFPLIILSTQAATALAADNTAVDTSQWECKYCAFEKGFSGTVDLGFGYVSDDSFKFGEYNGLYQKGGYFIGDAALSARGEDAHYWNVDASNLGLDSRSLGVEGGKQGTYKVILKYDELPHYISDSAATPFLGSGTDTLTLPGTWVAGSSTAGMTDLANSIQQVDLETKRKRLDLGVSLAAVRDWEFAVNVRHETKEGTQKIAGTFFFNAAQLVQPIDYETNQVDVSASYLGSKWQARLAYYGSTFSNNNSSLTWGNPYDSGLTGADKGQLALAPDNEFHQILASAGYSFSDKTRASADIALGHMTQNQAFLAPTLNASVPGGVPALPQSSLDGSVDTLNANLKVVSTLTDKWRLNAAFIYDDRNNKTPQAAYTWVTTDLFVNPATRTNLPYSFTKSTAKLSADYRATVRTRASAGYDYETMERTYQEVAKTTENTIWGKVNTRALENLDVMFKLAYADRGNSGYVVVPEISPPENPLLRKYNMASRTRDSAGLRADMNAWQTVNFGLGVDYANDDYSKSQIGLTESTDVTYSADASALLAKNTSMHLYLTREKIKSNQAGSQTFSTPDWTGENNDTVDTAGFGVKHTVTKNKFDVGADYTISHARGEVTVYTGASDPGFPDLVSKLGSLKFYANYRIKENISLNGSYWYESYKSENWQLNGVAPDTISNVLALGEQPPSYYVNVVMLSLRYKF
jgi:MtrB/PioB family decaheme-associated outer membrane protein